jgi:hypothetical protein
VTLRIANDIPSLRSQRRFALIRQCFANARQNRGLRLVEFTVLSNHLHLIVEAGNSVERAFSDHFHSELLKSPTRLVNAIRYVLDNAERHYGRPGMDFFSSEARDAEDVLAEPTGWLLRTRWRRAPGQLLQRLRQVPRYSAR